MKARRLTVLFLVTLLVGRPVQARDEWFRVLDLEQPVVTADLILIVRVSDVSEVKVILGGKAEQVTQQFKFQPVRTLKGVFARDELQLTNDDLGIGTEGTAPLKRGQLRLLLLGRSGIGYTNENKRGDPAPSVPLLEAENDPLRAAVEVLIAVSQEHDRGRRVTLLLEGLRAARGASAVPLLLALQRRALLAAQVSGTTAALTRHLADASPAVRETAARTLASVLRSDYLKHRQLREGAAAGLTAALERKSGDMAARVAALDALGAVGPAALRDPAAGQLKLDPPRQTFAERAALLQALGELKGPARPQEIVTLLEQLPLDAPAEVQQAALRALVRLDADQALKTLQSRLATKYAAGLDLQLEIRVLGELPAASAVPALLATARLSLNPAEQEVLASACVQVPDPRLVPLLAGMLDPRRPGLRWPAIEALRKIDTDEAARVLQPHLREEADLSRKLVLAEFLGRHGIRDGYPYALEHMSEPSLRDEAVAALAAIRDPRTVPALRDILQNSNNPFWNGAAIRALGALGAKEFVPRFLEMVEDLHRPLAPAALVALGDLGAVKALPAVRAGLKSRNDRIVLAAIRAATKLVPAAEEKTDEVRDQLAALLTDADVAQEVRAAVLEALVTLKDPRLDRALAVVVRDAGLEASSLLERVEWVLEEHEAKLTVPEP